MLVLLCVVVLYVLLLVTLRLRAIRESKRSQERAGDVIRLMKYCINTESCSKLTSETAQPAFQKLRHHLAIHHYLSVHNVQWMPKLKQGWVRLTYANFLEFYKIPIIRSL